jgi:hypothetical protein
MNSLDLLINVAKDVNNVFFEKKLKHLKKDLLELAKDNPNDMELGKKFRNLLNQ